MNFLTGSTMTGRMRISDRVLIEVFIIAFEVWGLDAMPTLSSREKP